MDNILYRIRNIVNNREYIGVTNNFDRRTAEHKRKPNNKIKDDLVTWSDFIFEIIMKGSETFCYLMEIEYIKKHKPFYNTSKGGKVTEGHKGSEHWNSELKEEDILDIVRMFENNISTNIISLKYGTDSKNITKILRGDTWKHVKRPLYKLENIFGENNPHSSMKEEDIVEIRYLYKTAWFTLHDLAHNYGCSFQHISDIINGKRWAHSAGPIKGLHYG